MSPGVTCFILCMRYYFRRINERYTMLARAKVKTFLAKYPTGKQIVPPNSNGNLVAVELTTTVEHSMSVCAILAETILPHVHERVKHVYMIVGGTLQFNKVGPDGIPNRRLMSGTSHDVVVIYPGEAHVAWSTNGPVELIVTSFPGNFTDDFHSVTDTGLMEKLMNGHRF